MNRPWHEDRPRCRSPFPVLLALLVMAAAMLAPAASGSADAVGKDREQYLDGTPTSFVVVGYSTSYAWPAMLQDMLDEHTGGERLYHVLNAVVGGAAVERWIGEPGRSDHDPTFGAMARDFLGPDARLRGPAPGPTIALCHQSLQFTLTRRGPIARMHEPKYDVRPMMAEYMRWRKEG